MGEPVAAAEPFPAEAAPGAQLDGTVIVVEDDLLIAAGMMELISGWGCQVYGGKSVDEAMRLCEAEGAQPDVAICDFRLGGNADGMAGALAIRRRYGEIPILLTSGSGDLGAIPGLPRAGFTLLTKPVRPGKLRAILQSLLVEPEAADEAIDPDV